MMVMVVDDLVVVMMDDGGGRDGGQDGGHGAATTIHPTQGRDGRAGQRRGTKGSGSCANCNLRRALAASTSALVVAPCPASRMGEGDGGHSTGLGTGLQWPGLGGAWPEKGAFVEDGAGGRGGVP